MIDFDLMLVHVGEFGLYQKILFLFQAPFCIFVTFVLFGQLFIYIYPRDFWCQENPCLNLDFPGQNLTREQRRNLSIPYNIQDRIFDPCNTYDVTSSQIEALIEQATQSCQVCLNSNRNQMCNYFPENRECLPRIAPRGRRDYDDDDRQYGSYNPWRRPTSPPGPGQGRGPIIFPTDPPPRGGVDFTTSPTTRRTIGPGPGQGGQSSSGPNRGSTTTTKPPVTNRLPIFPPGTASAVRNTEQVCPILRVNRFTIIRQNNETAEISFNTSESVRNPDVTLRNLNLTINRKPVNLPANIFIDTSNLARIMNWNTTPCRNWTFRREDLPYPTIVSELNWWCDAERRINIANAMFYLGAIVGGIGIGYIADMGGRVPALVTANLLGCLGGALSAIFYRNFYLFCFFRFICGMAFDNSFTMIYILVLEYVGPTYRTLVANLSIAVFYTIGTLILPWLALWIGNWRYYMLAISLPMSLAVIGIFVVPESARWLLSKGRTKEATRILRSFAKVNRRDVPEKIFVEFEADANLLYEEISKEKDATLMEAFKKPRIAKNFILLTLIWSMIALVYDGHSRNVLNLGENIFLFFTIASSTEFPADMLLIFTLDRFGRRWLAFGSLALSGGFSVGAAMVPAGSAAMSLVMALLARFWVNVAFNIGLQYAAELLPTVIRAQGVNVIHIMGYVASIVSPFIASIGRTNPTLSLLLLGGIALTGGALCLFLPESLGEDLPNTLEDGEVFGKNQSFWNCPICAKPKPVEEEKLEPSPVQLRHNMRASLRGEGFRSSIISSKRSTPNDSMMMHPMATETTRLKRGYTK